MAHTSSPESERHPAFAPLTKDSQQPRPVPWELHLISYLVLALECRDQQIRRLEELDHLKAVELDRLYTEIDRLRRAERMVA